MNKSMATGLVAGIAVATTVGAFAGYQALNRGPQFAEVVAVQKVTGTETVSEEKCEDVQVTKVREPKDERRIAGTAIGAVVGGVIGNQIGDGSGQTIATVAGAAAGGYAGNRIQKRIQEKDTYTVTEQRCRTVEVPRERTLGYDVSYRLGDATTTVRMESDPGVGTRFPVQDGKVVLTAAGPT